ncbi:MAG TPA: tRNA (N(6)-L-threonylcarbamoyladenosine(37)-C(2))-methylthiotransferase MtaB [Ignavibacteriaceae bacterium]|nr:tRNA (N(6)-L-threonylcarbamoyladenosine(37)-C(2))-methylthiotransferase MtaB [Ignavibacteriaceae bacterium]
MKNRVALHTLGCKLNYAETSSIGSQFFSHDFEIVKFDEKPDIFVFNTCTVTENAEKECRQLVRRALRINPEAFIIVTGCYAQLRPEEISKISGVDVVLGSNEKFKLFSLIENFEKNNLACIHVSPTDQLNEFGSSSSSEADTRTRAFFKIQDGCDYKCSFCTIPLARGISRSMDIDAAVNEFKKLLDEGYKEIILTGVNVGDYGSNSQINLFTLLKSLIKIEGEFRIRISSIEPNLLSDDIISLTADNEKLCNHFHIPLQSGSDKILRLMQRRYTASDYYKVVNTATKKIKDLGIGVDVITGFPEENNNDFLSTHSFLHDLPISYLHVFTYSERPNTKAINFANVVPIVERKKRNNILRSLSEKRKNEFYQKMISKNLQVLFEEENHNGEMMGFSSNYVRVKHPYDHSLVNTFSDVLISGVNNRLCEGQILEKKFSVDLVHI